MLMRDRCVGQQLLETLLERLSERGVATVEARLPGESSIAHSLLRDLGFSVLRHDVLMELDVREAATCFEIATTRQGLPSEVNLVQLDQELDRDPLAMSKLHALWIALAKEDPAHDPAGDPPLRAFYGWMRSPASMLGGCFLASVGKNYVGLTLLRRTSDDPHSLMQNLTGVLPEYRRRGVATALKQAAKSFAFHSGFESLRTWVAGSNDAIRSLNTRLGYRNRLVLTVFEKTLPTSDVVA
jgi:ribosomal protein S18 acetylase RimI-like enzyme